LYGAIRLIGAIWLAFFSNTATMMFGALLGRVPNPFAMMDFFHIFYTSLVVLSTVCGVLGILAGLSLVGGQASGRILAIAAAFLSLSEIPLGIALGVYTLIILLPWRRPAHSTVRREAVSNLHGQPSTV
jgi:uncharacterized membrane protein (UPF0136 family)